MKTKRDGIIAMDSWNLPESMLILVLFVPTQEELPLTELERLGIWAARRAREQALRSSQIDQENIDDPLRRE